MSMSFKSFKLSGTATATSTEEPPPSYEAPPASASPASASKNVAKSQSTKPPKPPVSKDSVKLIAVMGATGSGKTTFINKVSGSELRIGRGLTSETSEMQLSAPFELDGHTITLIDSPGFDDTIRSDTDVLKQIATFLSEYYEKGMMLTGVIYMHPISDRRMTGVSRRNFNMFRQLCGDSTLKNVAIVTNMWEELTDRSTGENREAELRDKELFFKPVLDNGAVLLRHEGTLESGQVVLQYLLENIPEALKIQREMVDEHLDVSETAASTTLSSELVQLAEKHKQELRDMQDEMRAAIKAKDERTRRELEMESRKVQTEVTRLQNESTKLATEFKAMQEKSAAEYTSRIEALEARFRLTSIDTQERRTLQEQMDDIRKQYMQAAGPRRGQRDQDDQGEGSSTKYFTSWGLGGLRLDFMVSSKK